MYSYYFVLTLNLFLFLLFLLFMFLLFNYYSKFIKKIKGNRINSNKIKII